MAKRTKFRKSQSEGSSTIADIARDYAAAESRFSKVEAEYLSVKGQLDSLRSAMLKHLGASSMPADAAGRGAGRQSGRRVTSAGTPRAGTLGDHIIKVLSGGQDMGPTEVFDAVKKAGFKSDGTEKSQSVMVTQTLGKLAKKGLILKKGRGVYGAAKA